jgi:hypothetical protein
LLKYVGKGDFIPGVPARDLEDEDLDEFLITRAGLIASGLYVEVKAVVTVRDNKILSRKVENKEADDARS